MEVYMRLFMYLLFPALLFAQADITLRGTIVDTRSNKPLQGANILLESQDIGTASDQDGSFVIQNAAPGEQVLSVSYIGFQIYKERIKLTGDRSLVIKMQPSVLPGQQVMVTAARADERKTPVAFTNMPASKIRESYTVQDVPMLLNELPNVYSYSDAGNGIGYSYLKVRGFDQTRVGVMINGIPLNDPEDHQVYWVDMPDLAANIEDIQLQRGVSNSLFGVSAFGGSVNLLTSSPAKMRGIQMTTGTGSYNTRKFSVEASSGLVNNTYAVYGRFSRIESNGYRDHSGAELWSYFIAAERYGEHTTTKLNIYGGPEVTYASWDAVREDIMKKDRTFNPTSADYKNTIDNFNQPHYELFHEWTLSPTLKLNNTFFYILGEGYYEGLKTNRRMRNFGFPEITTLDPTLFGSDSLSYYATTDKDGQEVLQRDDQGRLTLERTDLVRQKWVNKSQYGWLPRLDWNHGNGVLTVGGHFDFFNSEHWGDVLWAAGIPGSVNPDLQYYNYFGEKLTTALYVHELYQITPQWLIAGDFQIQYKYYKFRHGEAGNFKGENKYRYKVDYQFFNPKLGTNYNINQHFNTFASFSVSQREPIPDNYFDTWEGPDDLGARPLFANSKQVIENGEVSFTEWSDPMVDPERVYDYEWGVGYLTDALHLKANLYYMDFRNEIIPYGQVDDDGQPIRGNAPKAIHRGIELVTRIDFTNNLEFDGNLSLSQNYFKEFHEKGWDENWNVIELDYSGNTIPLFPNRIGNARLTYRTPWFRALAQVQHIGRQYLDNSESIERSIDPHTVLNLGLTFKLEDLVKLPNTELSLRINNVLDEKYITSGYYDPWSGYNYYYPAALRNFYISLTTGI